MLTRDAQSYLEVSLVNSGERPSHNQGTTLRIRVSGVFNGDDQETHRKIAAVKQRVLEHYPPRSFRPQPRPKVACGLGTSSRRSE